MLNHGNRFFYWHLRMSSKNVDLNICARTWHSVSAMGHKQGLKLAVPVFTRETDFTKKKNALQPPAPSKLAIILTSTRREYKGFFCVR